MGFLFRFMPCVLKFIGNHACNLLNTFGIYFLAHSTIVNCQCGTGARYFFYLDSCTLE